MLYYSTNNQSPLVDFREATIRGQAPDKGLYFPERIPAVGKEMVESLRELSREEIAYRVMRPYVGKCIPEEALRRILAETIEFPIPLVPVTDRIHSLELFHGPTLAFKDVGARFMSRCLGFFTNREERQRKITVLVATSGDTGGAVASGFLGVEGVEVIILYPSGKVSPVQEKQLTALGQNIHAIELEGSFDDCQRLVKQAFADPELASRYFLTSANSINVARWLPQQLYYFFALQQWPEKEPPVISVPSGNFGNICAGMLAMESGLPVRHFIAACNANDMVAQYLRTAEWSPRAAIPTLSNAMDVGDPSNFVRILEIVRKELASLRERLTADVVTDAETVATIGRLHAEYHYLSDPHGAVGFLSLERYLDQHPGQKGIFLETAHPVKFPEAVEKITGSSIPVPGSLAPLMKSPKLSLRMAPDYAIFRDWLIDRS